MEPTVVSTECVSFQNLSDALARGDRTLERAIVALKVAELWVASAAASGAARKWGDSWQNQPRVPYGNPDGGQWTTEDDGAGGPSPPNASDSQASPDPPTDDAVFHPATDRPQITLTDGGSDEESRSSSETTSEVRTLESIFPALRANSAAEILVAPLEAFVGFGEAADAANLEATMVQYNSLIAEIKRLDPNFTDSELLPEGGIASLDWQARGNLIDNLRMKLAAEYYLVNGDIKPLQGEVLMFLQRAVDRAYDKAADQADDGRLQPRLSREEAIGNQVDAYVRRELKTLLSSNGVDFGPGEDVLVNNRDYQTTDEGRSYRIPDARLGDIAYDWTLSTKTVSDAQIRGFFAADSEPDAVIIIRPSKLGGDAVYFIRRPDETKL